MCFKFSGLLLFLLIIYYANGQILTNSTGLCTSEGATECCQRDCQGQPNDCYCDESCLEIRDCCRDIYKFTTCGSRNGSDCVHGDVRLQEIANNWPLATVDICLFGFWEPICGDFWNESDVQFVCSYLGFTAILGSVKNVSVIPSLNNTYSLQCIGNETAITNCIIEQVTQCSSRATSHCNMCPKGCVNGNCSAAHTCSCYLGWTGDTCNEDINECENRGRDSNDRDRCEQICINTNGSYYCDCKVGFLLANDGFKCEEITMSSDLSEPLFTPELTIPNMTSTTMLIFIIAGSLATLTIGVLSVVCIIICITIYRQKPKVKSSVMSIELNGITSTHSDIESNHDATTKIQLGYENIGRNNLQLLSKSVYGYYVVDDYIDITDNGSVYDEITKNRETPKTTSTNQDPSFVYSISSKHNGININTPVDDEADSLGYDEINQYSKNYTIISVNWNPSYVHSSRYNADIINTPTDVDSEDKISLSENPSYLSSGKHDNIVRDTDESAYINLEESSVQNPLYLLSCQHDKDNIKLSSYSNVA